MPSYYPNQQGDRSQDDDAYYDEIDQFQYGYDSANQYLPPQHQIQLNMPHQPSPLTPSVPQQFHYQQPQSIPYQQHNPLYYQQAQDSQFQHGYLPQQAQHQHQYFQQLTHPQPHLQHQAPYALPQQSQNYSDQQPLQQQTQRQYQTHVPNQTVPSQQQRILQDVQPNAPRQQPQPPKPAQPDQSDQPEPDYAMLLLCLADEYLEAASKLTVRSDEYFKLTATALACIESVLTNFKLSPLREAQVSLRYAQLLHCETENNDDAETILTKTVELCERMKFMDLKYAAQLLLAQVLHRSNSKAAIKDMQSIIQDIETYKHSAWEYAFRLQLVSFFMASAMPSDVHASITQLERLCHTAKQNGDHTIYAFASILETLANLQSSSSDSTQAAHRALAKARAMQLNDDVSGNPQLIVMMEFLDLCIHIKESDVAHGEPKRKMMQSVLYSALENPNWRNDGTMYLPISQSVLRGLQTQDGGIILNKHGKYCIALSWLSKDEVEDLGYLLSGVSAAFKNAGDNGKAEKFLDEGLDMLKEMSKERRSVTYKADVVRARRHIVETHFLIERVFLQCSKGQWNKAEVTLGAIEDIVSDLSDLYPPEMSFLLDYVRGSVAQGQGNLEEALNLFAAQIRKLTTQATATPGNRGSAAQRKEDVYRNVSILSAMNTIFIIQQGAHPQHHRLQQLINMLDPLVHGNPHKAIQAVWNFILAILPNNTTLKTKQYLSYALNAAQAINNAQVTTLCLTAMHDKFFLGVIGDQAIKCARAATHQAKKLNDPLWISVTTGLESHSLNVHGMSEEAMKKWEESERASIMLPERVRP